jgi:hypothetical protein
MWPKFYRDYEIDKPVIKYQVQPGRGIVGCEMHDLNGWGEVILIPIELNTTLKNIEKDL